MRIYLDNNATTAIHPGVLSVLETTLRDAYGNASSIHREGQRARRVIEDARDSVARLVGATARDIVFTSGGSESNNAAIFGSAPVDGRFHIVTTTIEHPSVTESVRELESRGVADVTRVAPALNGRIVAEEVIDAIRPDTRLVIVMMANNETGVVQPVAEIGSACRERGVHFHCDAVQAAGKIEVDVAAIGCDTLALGAHKMHGPKGIGALFVRRGVTMTPYIFGGSQERRRRAGTENVPLAAAFGAAAALPSAASSIAALRDSFEERLGASDLAITINGAAVERLPNTSNVTFHGADGEGIVIGLDLSGVATSTGSACSSGRVEPSRILLAMGLTPNDARSTVRFSLSRFTTADEIDRVVDLVTELVPRCTAEARAGAVNAT